MRRGGFLPIGGALGLALFLVYAGLAPPAHAQVALTERVRIQAGYFAQQNPPPLGRLGVGFAGAQPGVTLYWFQPDATYSVDESVNGILYTDGTAEFDEFLTLAGAFQLAPKTQMLLSANGAYTSLTQLLIANPAPNTPVTLLPATGTKLVSLRLNESIRHDLTDKLRLTQNADAAIYSTLAPAPPLDTLAANVGLGLQRIWTTNSLGFDLATGFGEVLTIPPAQDVHYGTVNAGPTWRHDWTSTISSSLNAGASAAFSFDQGSPVFGPSATATVAYIVQPALVTLSYVTGYYPSFLTGQLAQVNSGTLHALYPLSISKQIFLGTTVGGGHTNLVNLQGPANDVGFNSIFSDVDLTWQATPLIQPFARYQFIGQIASNDLAATLNPSYLRDTFLVGLQITSIPPGANRGTPGGYAVPTTFPQRVDDKDNPAAPPTPTDVPPSQQPSTSGVSDGVQHPEDRGLPPPQDPNMPDNGSTRWIYTTKPAQPVQPAPSQPKPSGSN